MYSEFRLELFESNDILLLVPLTSRLPGLSDICVTELVIGISLHDFPELMVFHLLSIAVLSEDLVQWLSNTVEQLFDDFNDRMRSLTPLDSKQLLVVIGHVVDDSRLEQRLTSGNSFRIQVILQFTNQLMD